MSAEAFFCRLEGYGDKSLLIDRGNTYSAADLCRKIVEYRGQLQPIVKSGDAVALLSDYSFGAVAALLALAQLKAVAIPIVTSSPECFAVFPPQHVLSFDGDVLKVEKVNDAPVAQHPLQQRLTQQNHAGLVLFSSGSTDAPKAMLHDLTNLLAHYAARGEKNLTLLAFLMFDHIGGLNTLLNSLAMGTKLVLASNRDVNEVAALIAMHKVNVLPASPTFLNLLLLNGALLRHDFSSLKMITYGTEPMPESLLARLRKAFPSARFLQTFGTSETGIVQTKSVSSESLWLRMEDPDVEHRIENGELWLRSKTQILGYLNAPMDSFDEEGWFHTGDLVEQNADGALRIVGRRKEMINVGGEKVLPAEVESVLLALSVVQDCVVYGKPNAITGQCVTAEVVVLPEARNDGVKKDIRKACMQKLAPYKVPAQIILVDAVDAGERFKKKRINRA